MNDKNKWIKILHVAKKQCGLSDAKYRQFLEGAAGISSASQVETEFQFRQIMEQFKKLGFTSNRPRQTHTRKHENRWGCTEAQRYYIEGLWKLMSRSKDLESLEKLIRRITKIDHPRFLDKKAASMVILAMRKMCIDQGIDPDRKDNYDK